MNRLHGFEIRQSSCLAGGKKAVKCGSIVYVSPAMEALMIGASSDELRRLLSAIEVIEIPDIDLVGFHLAP